MKTKLKVIIPIAIAVTAIIFAVIFIQFKPNEVTVEASPFDLAQNYLVEHSYEQAIAEFEKAIELDPMNVEAYLGIAEAYEAIGNRDMAVQWLEKGFEATGDERIIEYLARGKGDNEEVSTDNETFDYNYANADEEFFILEQEEMVTFYVPYEFSGDPNSEYDLRYGYYDDIAIYYENSADMFIIMTNRQMHTMRSIFCIDKSADSFSQRYSISDFSDKPLSSIKIIPQCKIYNSDGSVMCEYKDYGNENGQIKKREYYQNGMLASTITYEYDNQGNIVSIVDNGLLKKYNYDDNGRLIEDEYGQKLEYDSNGNIVKSSGESWYTEYAYDSVGNLISEFYFSNGNKVQSFLYEYHPNGVYKKIQYKYENGESISEFNSDGLVILSSELYDYYHVLKYNSYGDRIEQGDGDWSQKYDNYYDDSGRLIKQVDSSISKSYYYDEKDNITEERTEYNYSSDVYEKRYIYDSSGKRIKVENYYNGTLESTAEVTEFIRLEIPKSILEEAKINSHLFPSE